MSVQSRSPVSRLFERLEPRNLLAVNLVADVGSLGRGSDPVLLGSYQGEVQLAAVTADGLQILTTDGTERGTRAIFDTECRSRCRSSNIQGVSTAVGTLFLQSEYDVDRGESLSIWRAPADASSSPQELIKLYEGQQPQGFWLHRVVETPDIAYALIHVGSRESYLVSTNGSANGSRIEQIFDSRIEDIGVAGDRLFVAESDRRSDLTGGKFPRVQGESVVAVGDRVIVDGQRGVSSIDSENELTDLLVNAVVRQRASNTTNYYFSTPTAVWSTDGTRERTLRLARNVSVQAMAASEDGVYFATFEDPTLIWKSTGSEPSQVVIDLGRRGRLTDMMWSAGRLHFRFDGEYWTSDGTQDGTRAMGTLLHSDGVQALGDGRVLFIGSTDGTNKEPWVSDGSLAGTMQVADLQPGTRSADFVSHLFNFENTRFPGREMVWFRDRLYFGVEDALYRSDGTLNGTETYFAPVQPDVGDPLRTRLRIDALQAMEDRLFFFATTFDDRHAIAITLWATDGESNLNSVWSTPLKDREWEVQLPVDLFVSENELFFRRNTAAGHTELWTADGTSDGTILLASTSTTSAEFKLIDQHIVFWERDELIALDRNSQAKTTLTDNASISPLHAIGDSLVFAEDDGRLWVTNGVDQAGNYLDLRGRVKQQLVGGDLLYLVVDRGGTEVWRTDGTPEGTFKIADGDQIYVADEQLYFWKDHYELFTSDGTIDGTRLIYQIPHSLGVDRCCLSAAGDSLFFIASNQEYGRELWRFAEDADNPLEVLDVVPGPQSSWPTQLTPAGADLYFSAESELLGRELFRFTPDLEQTADFDGNGTVDFDDFVILSRNFGKQSAATSEEGDTNGDGAVDFEDFLFLSTRYEASDGNAG